MMHYYYRIPGWFAFHDVYDRAVALSPDPAHFVEVGCWKGRSTTYLGVTIVNSGKKIRLDCVDTFKGSMEHRAVDSRALMAEFYENMQVLSGKLDYRILAKWSVEAAALYKDGTLDFVFLDGSHAQSDVYADILAWKPKLKPTGVLAGDDLAWEGVSNALLRHGYGTKDSPIVVSGGTYLSWIIPPEDQLEAWKTVREPEIGRAISPKPVDIETARKVLKDAVAV